ncbi:hypothetical protein [Roseicella aquatilis]|nr:hypothetical protein [Roseicella aquatilis]
MRAAAILLLLALAGCAGSGASGPYLGGALGGTVREDARLR